MKDKDIKTLSDQYWQKMQVVLDKEMPIQKRRRKYPFYLVLGMVATFFIIISISIFNTDHINNNKQSATTVNAAVNLNKNVLKNNDITIDSNFKNHVTEDHNQLSAQKSIKNTESSILNNSIEIVGLEIETVPSNYKLLYSDQHNDKRPTTIKEDESTEKTEIVEVADVKENEQIIIYPIGRLDSDKLLYAFNIQPLKPYFISDKQGLFKFGIEASALTHNYQTLGQYNAGLLGQMDIGKRFYGIAGIQYSQFTKNVQFAQEVLSKDGLQNSVLENVTLSSVVSGTANSSRNLTATEVVSDITNKLHYAVLHLGIGYRFDRKWAVESHISNYRLISASYISNQALNDSLVSIGAMALDQKTLDSKQPVHRRSMFSFDLGIQYNINNHLSVGIHGVWWPVLSSNQNDTANMNATSLDATQNFLSSYNQQKSTLSTGLKIRYVW